MISGNPNQLHIYSPQNQADTTVLLSKPPLSLAVSPDGMHALVGHDQLVSYVNLSTAAVEKATPISVSAQNVALSNSWIYVLPAGSASTPTAVSINIATGTVVYTLIAI